MRRGLRPKAFRLLMTALDQLKSRQKVTPSTLLLAVFLRLSPEVQIKGVTRRAYVAPVTANQRVSFAVRWLLNSVRSPASRRGVTARHLADALEDALFNRGTAVSTKKKIYKQAATQKHQRLPFKYL